MAYVTYVTFIGPHLLSPHYGPLPKRPLAIGVGIALRSPAIWCN